MAGAANKDNSFRILLILLPWTTQSSELGVVGVVLLIHGLVGAGLAGRVVRFRHLPRHLVVEQVRARHFAENRQPQDESGDQTADQSHGQRHGQRDDLIASLLRRGASQSRFQTRNVASQLGQFERAVDWRARWKLAVQTEITAYEYNTMVVSRWYRNELERAHQYTCNRNHRMWHRPR